ncbi:MAG: hypothetical protein PHF63_10505 [Herbinix sp.]|nr:hypothetical protein [Herbinix sp.]
MKLKYKKIILLTTMSTMGIGILTISASNDRTQAQENLSAKSVQEAGLLAVSSEADINIDDMEITVTAALTATPIPSPTPMPVYDIEKDNYPKITKLFKDFYIAKNDRDVDTIKKILSDPTKVESQDELQKKTQYIEEYSNITAYTKKGFEEGTYIVYVYHEIKFTGINTPAPGLSKFYVITDENNKLKIFSGEMDETTQAYYDDRNKDEDVVALIEMTNTKSKKAMNKDEDLKNFWKNIKELASSNATQAEGDSAE